MKHIKTHMETPEENNFRNVKDKEEKLSSGERYNSHTASMIFYDEFEYSASFKVSSSMALKKKLTSEMEKVKRMDKSDVRTCRIEILSDRLTNCKAILKEYRELHKHLNARRIYHKNEANRHLRNEQNSIKKEKVT